MVLLLELKDLLEAHRAQAGTQSRQAWAHPSSRTGDGGIEIARQPKKLLPFNVWYVREVALQLQTESHRQASSRNEYPSWLACPSCRRCQRKQCLGEP